MTDPLQAAAPLLRRDSRYSFEAYTFVLEAMEFAREELGMGREAETENAEESLDSYGNVNPATCGQKHVTGQQLCEAIRLFALRQFGNMARCVFKQWGIMSTSDIGEIVFNMIDLRIMMKTPADCREDFDSVYEMDKGLRFDFSRAMRDIEPAV